MTFEPMKQDRKQAKQAERNQAMWEATRDRKQRCKERTMKRKGMRKGKQGVRYV